MPPALPADDEETSPVLEAADPVPDLQTAEDVALFLEMRLPELLYVLYRAPDQVRYRHFEIPKRTGGMRLISSPNGLLRDAQYRLLPLLQSAYDAHPAAHGFIPARGVVSNAVPHSGQRLVLNIDLLDFFPSINFGRVRGLFMKPPFGFAPKAATVLAQICTYRNGLPQGAPTSPVLSNFIAASLDRRLLRLARENKVTYTRYADDITLSTSRPTFPPALAVTAVEGSPQTAVEPGEALQEAIEACGFAINPKKIRLQARGVRQSVTGLTVNEKPNVERTRIRRLRAMLHAWAKFGLDAAAAHHFQRYSGRSKGTVAQDPGRAFRNIVYGHLSFVKMVRGADDEVFLKLCAKLIPLDPNPSRFIRQMVFGGDDFDVFISHASEDKPAIARPVFEACERAGIKAFLDEEHIAWGKSFTDKINTALGAARTVLAVVTQNSVTKEWPLAEMNSALALEVSGEKTVVVLLVGNPDLARLPLIKTKKYLVWKGDPDHVARELSASLRRTAPNAGQSRTAPEQPPPPGHPAQNTSQKSAVPSVPAAVRPPPPPPPASTNASLSALPIPEPGAPPSSTTPANEAARKSLLERLLSIKKLGS